MPKPHYVSATKIVVKLVLDIISKSIQWHDTALWDLTPLFQLYGGQKTNFLIWTVLGEIITVLTCIWLVRTASSLRLAETNSEDPFFFSEVLAQI